MRLEPFRCPWSGKCPLALALSAPRPRPQLLPQPACWAPCEKTYLPLAVTIPLPLPSSSCALWIAVSTRASTQPGVPFAERLTRHRSPKVWQWWGIALLPLEMWISEAESSPGHQEKVCKRKGKSEGQKGLIKRGPFIGAASGVWGVEEDFTFPCILRAPAPNHPHGSLSDMLRYFSALLDWGVPRGLVSWC